MASLLCLSSCIKNFDDITSDSSKTAITLSGNIKQEYQTLVNDDGFCNGDMIGVYITDYNGTTPGTLLDKGNRADNVRYTYDGSTYKWTPSEPVYWKDNKTNIDVYGYYPYADPSSISSYSFDVQKDQSTSAAYGKMGNYEASDFLWGKAENVAPTDKVITIGFHHMMACIKVTLAEGTGFGTGEWEAAQKQILVLNTKRGSSVNLTNGAVTATGDVPTTGTIPYKDGNSYRAIVVPQTVAAGKQLISITINGLPYYFKKDEAFTYNPSKQHNFTITVNKRTDSGYDLILTAESITAWVNDNVSHDATAREYIIVNVAEPGTLSACLRAAKKNKAKVKNLKLTGKLNATDFYFMRDSMDVLQALNLKEVSVDTYSYWNGTGTSYGNGIPGSALNNKKTLLRLVLPDGITSIESRAFIGCENLVGSLIIPEGVTHIGDYAFYGCKSLTGTLTLPSTLKEIAGYAFSSCGFTCELILPTGLTTIGQEAFSHCHGIYGSLKLPESLTILSSWSFYECDNITGSITIPKGIKKIEDWIFVLDRKLNGNLILHDGITSIGQRSFSYCHFKGELNLPKNLTSIGEGAFQDCEFSGTLKIPSSVSVIASSAFANNWRLSGILELPSDLQVIGDNAFNGCTSLEGLIIPEGIATISSNAFLNCYGIGRIVCKNTTPPYLASGAFDGVPKNNFTVEVPESAVAVYQTTAGWSDFKRISAYRNLVITPRSLNALNNSVTRDLLLRADEEWEVSSKPDWVSLNKTSGTGKTQLVLTFSEMASGSSTRTGDVVFKLKNKDYTTTCTVTQYNYQYAENQFLTLQNHSVGNGVNVVFLGDGFDGKDISEGTYLTDVKKAMENFFSIEPYKTYRNYFNVYTGISLSQDSGLGTVNTVKNTKFGTTYFGDNGSGLGATESSYYSEILAYACNAPTVSSSNIGQTLVVMIPNTTDYGGVTYMYDDGSAIAYCPVCDFGYPFDFRGVIQHEAGGHGFGKLGDEYIYVNAFIDACTCSNPHSDVLRSAQAKGWYANLSLTGNMNKVSWSHFIFNDKYSQIVDVFEGGFFHSRGVFRPEQNSCMNNNIPYYNAPSREAIVKRIMSIAGETYSFANFVANDVISAASPTSSKATYQQEQSLLSASRSMLQHAPVMMGKRPSLSNFKTKKHKVRFNEF